MNGLRHLATRAPTNGQFSSVVRPSYGRAAVHRRLVEQTQTSNLHSLTPNSSSLIASLQLSPLRSKFLPDDIRTSLGPAVSARSFCYGARLRQEKEAKPASESAKEGTAETESGKKASGENESEAGSAGEKTKGESQGEGNEEGKEKETPPPPPPHGDKSPWQVFTDTLETEFKASKEWNESTKALQGDVQRFTESESVRRARLAYEATTGKVASTAGTVLKGTAGAVGKGAAWTWETPVVKAARTTVNATASVIEKGTRPIRETEAYKDVKNVIDDGSSSRYGGWTEKEERRKAREARELEEAKRAGTSSKRVEVPTEDPK
jgi:mitochondrial import inner membrane translocase subunit TIM44